MIGLLLAGCVQRAAPEPERPVAALWPADAHADEALRCDVVVEAPGATSHEVRWTVDGVPWAGESVPAGVTGFGETWACTVVADTGVASEPVSRTLPEAPGGNVLLVILDDVGVDKLPAWGEHPEQPILPVLDGLAASGLRFDRAWATPTCSPTRAALLTGRLGRRTGVGSTVDSPGNAFDLAQDEELLPEVLSGHTSALLGKWHLDEHRGLDWPDRIFQQGFDHFAGTRANISSVPVTEEPPPPGEPRPWGYEYFEKYEDGRLYFETTYATTDTVDDALALVPTLPEPWLVVLSLHAAHEPEIVPPDGLVHQPVDATSERWQLYNATLEAADTELGRLLDGLDLAETHIVVVGDNGTPEHAIRPPFDAMHGKGTVFEGGVLVPLIVSGPAVAQPGTATDALVHVTDLFPTLLHLAGARVGERPIDGLTLLPYLADPEAPRRRDHLYTERFAPNGAGPYDADQRAVRDDRYKLIETLDGRLALFELLPDEGPELTDLTPEQEEAKARLGALLDAYASALP